jgi:hypothetical protein
MDSGVTSEAGLSAPAADSGVTSEAGQSAPASSVTRASAPHVKWVRTRVAGWGNIRAAPIGTDGTVLVSGGWNGDGERGQQYGFLWTLRPDGSTRASVEAPPDSPAIDGSRAGLALVGGHVEVADKTKSIGGMLLPCPSANVWCPYFAEVDADLVVRRSRVFESRGALYGIRYTTNGMLFSGKVFDGTIDFGKGEIAGPTDFVVRLGGDWAPLWQRTFHGASTYSFSPFDDGSFAIGGDLFPMSDFDGGLVLQAGDQGVFAALMDANGDLRWAHALSASSHVMEGQIAALVGGDVMQVGLLNGSFDWGVANGQAPDLWPKGGWVARYGADGQLRSASFAVDVWWSGVVPLADGRVVVVGSASGSFDLGGAHFDAPERERATAVVVGLDPQGAFEWALTWTSTEDVEPFGVTSLPNGDLVVVGSWFGELSVGGNVLVAPPTNDGGGFVIDLAR